MYGIFIIIDQRRSLIYLTIQLYLELEFCTPLKRLFYPPPPPIQSRIHITNVHGNDLYPVCHGKEKAAIYYSFSSSFEQQLSVYLYIYIMYIFNVCTYVHTCVHMYVHT